MICLICKSDSLPYCVNKVLGKYNVQYYRCTHCQFIFTESPYWLEEAYSSAITRLDIGLTERNETMVPVVETIIKKWLNQDGRFIDYGGGYGMLVRMMRDRGFDYFRQDIFCQNLFAESFDVTDVPPFRAELLTAFEVMEHLVDPIIEMGKILSLSDTILFSTTVQPAYNVTPDSWWYFTSETGQHVSLFSRKSLQVLSDQFNLNYCWNDQNLHLFSRKVISNYTFKIMTHPRLSRLYNNSTKKRPTLQNSDFAFIKSKLTGKLNS